MINIEVADSNPVDPAIILGGEKTGGAEKRLRFFNTRSRLA